MNPFEVEWTDDSLDQLATLWLSGPDRTEIVRAQARIDSLLRQDPLRSGAEVSEGLRELSVAPLRVLYSVDSGSRTVEVAAVKRT